MEAHREKFLQPHVNRVEFVQIQNYSYSSQNRDTVNSSRHGGTFGRGCLLHWDLDRRKGLGIFFLAEGRTRTSAAAPVRCETGLPPGWCHRIEVRHPALMSSRFWCGRRRQEARRDGARMNRGLSGRSPAKPWNFPSG